MTTHEPPSFWPKICSTASAMLWHEEKLLLIHHKKLDLWLTPGGHIDPGELPHEAAVRECFEETGVRVQAVAALGREYETQNARSAGVPDQELTLTPVSADLHWVCRENYDRRQQSPDEYQPVAPWKRGCELHHNSVFLVEPVAGVELVQNVEETLGIGWYTVAEIEAELNMSEINLRQVRVGYEARYGTV